MSNQEEAIAGSYDENARALVTDARRAVKTVTFGGADGAGKYQSAAAVLSTALTGSNNDIDYTADTTGKAGNNITIEYVDPGTPEAELSVGVVGNAIAVSLATQALVAASLTTSLTGTHNDLVLTAKEAGADGNDITLAYVDPDKALSDLRVDVAGTDIIVRLATVGGLFASGVLTTDNTELADGATVTIGSTVYRFKDTLAQAYDVKRHGTTADTTMGNLIKAINGTGTAGTDYFAGTVAHPNVTAGALAAHAFTITAKVAGEAANSIATTETSSHLSFAQSTLVGGNNGVISSTAADIKYAVEHNHDANNLVSIALAGGNNGTGVVTALSETNLTGGEDAEIITTGDELKAAIAGNVAAAALVNAADKSGNDGSGIVTAMAATALTGGADVTIPLFKVKGSVLITLCGPAEVALTGASATLVHGIAGTTSLLIASITATNLTKRKAIDKTGILTNVGDAMNVTPSMPLFDGEDIIATPGTANITAGKVHYQCYYKPLTPGATVTPA